MLKLPYCYMLMGVCYIAFPIIRLGWSGLDKASNVFSKCIGCSIRVLYMVVSQYSQPPLQFFHITTMWS